MPAELAAGSSLIEGKVEPDEGKPDADRLGWRPGVLSRIDVEGLLIEESQRARTAL